MATNPTPSLLDQQQIIQRAFDGDTDRLRVDSLTTIEPPVGGLEVNINQENDSIALGDGTQLITASNVDSKVGLDVNVLNAIDAEFTPSGFDTAIKNSKVIVGDTPTKLPAMALIDRNGISIKVWGVNTVYIGDMNVTVDEGYPKKQYEEIQMDVKDNSSVEVYGICESGKTCEVRIIEIS